MSADKYPSIFSRQMTPIVYLFANMKMEPQRWPEMSLILERSGTQCVVMVTKPVYSNCRAHLVEYCCKESNISDLNWPRYCFFIIIDQNLVECKRSSLS